MRKPSIYMKFDGFVHLHLGLTLSCNDFSMLVQNNFLLHIDIDSYYPLRSCLFNDGQ